MSSLRPSTPNMVMYDDEDDSDDGPKVGSTVLSATTSRPGTAGASTLAPPPPLYKTPPDTGVNVSGVGAGIWTVEGKNNDPLDVDEDGESTGEGAFDNEETHLELLDKEFEDFYEDHVHKSAGPVVFVSKTLGMLPVIWTEDESESECKSYFNLYTFVVFIGWLGLAVVSALRMDRVDEWPGDGEFVKENKTDPQRFITRAAFDTYMTATWVSALVTLLFGVFKCRSFAEVLFGLSHTDAQLELREKHYEKIKRKSLYWIVFLLILLGAHGFAFYTILDDSGIEDGILLIADVLGHACIFVLDLQFLHFSMVLCKRYRLVNKILVHITRPWKNPFNTDDPPPCQAINEILHFRPRKSVTFDALFGGGADTEMDVMKHKMMIDGLPIQLDQLMTATEDGPGGRTSKEEENTFILQLDILRSIHGDLAALAHEVNHLLGFQILIHVITSVVFVVMFGYFFSAAMIDKEFYWPYLVLFLLPCIRILLVGHWGQVLEMQSRQPFMTICQVSTVDASPRLERQVQKLTIQMHHQCPQFTAAGFFTLGRNMILKTIGVAVVFTFFMVKFKHQYDATDPMMQTSASE